MSKPLLELTMVDHPHSVLEIGLVDHVPAVGDYVMREDSGWWGYVKSRRWKVTPDGKMTIRCFLQREYL